MSAPVAPPLVLVVDDDARFAQALATSLGEEAAGRFRVEHLTDPDALLARAATHAEELAGVVSDYDLKHPVSGLALLERVRESCPRAKRILVTGHDLARFAADPGFARLDAAYEKPLRLQEIAAPIARLVARAA